MPIKWNPAPQYIRDKYLDKYYEYRNFSVGPDSLHTQRMNIDEVMKFIHGVNHKTCAK